MAGMAEVASVGPAAIAVVPTISGYDELVSMGRGGSAEVYRAQHATLARAVAVKVWFDSSDVAVAEAKAEVAVSARMAGHPGVVSVLDAGVLDDGRPWVAMDHHPGSLADRLAYRRAVPESDVIELGIAMCDSLAALHRSGVRHGDLSLANVMISEFGHPVIIDFGCSAVVGVEGPLGVGRRGTLDYLAPECRAGGPATIAADVFALGQILRKLLGVGPGESASSGDSTTGSVGGEAVVGGAVGGVPDRSGVGIVQVPGLDGALGQWLSEPGVPLQRLIGQLLSDDPLDRPSSAEWVGERLTQMAAGVDSGGPSVGGSRADRDGAAARSWRAGVGLAAIAATSMCSLAASILAVVSVA